MAAAAAFLVLTAMAGMGRGGHDLAHGYLLDYTIVSAAGRALLEGANAYVPAEFEPYMRQLARGVDPASPYSYPPHLTTLMAPFAAAPRVWGQAAWVLLLLACIAVSARIVRDLGGGLARDPARGLGATPGFFAALFPALFVANPVTSHDLWLGQPALIAACGLLLVLAGRLRKRPAVTVVGLVLAAIKPQLSLLVFFYLALEGAWREIGIAALIGLALSVPELVTFGPRGLVTSYVHRIETHGTWWANLPGSESSIGVRSLLWVLGVHAPGLEVVGLALTALMWRFRGRIAREEDRFALIVGLTLLFLFNQDSAYVLIVPLVAVVARHTRGRRRLPWALVALGVVFIQPRRMIRHFGHPTLSQWRTLVVAALVALLVLALRAEEKGEPLMPSFGRRPRSPSA
jgi:hypothetical protein